MKAALLAVLAAFGFNLETVISKALAHQPIALVVLVRALGQLLWVAPALWQYGPTLLHTRQPQMQVFRGALSVTSWGFYFTAFAKLPLATATTLNFTSVLFVTALAAPVLKEKVGWQRWTAALVGFLGVLIVLRPGSVPLGWEVAASLFAAFLSACIVLTTRHLARSEKTLTIMAYIGIVTVAGALPFGLPHLHWPGWRDALLFAGLALAGPAAMHVWITALRMADASVLAPISYTRLIFGVLAGLLLFREVPSLWLVPGAALIIGSALYITRQAGRA